jgi:hypothetical protein
MVELAIFFGLPTLAFFDKRHAAGIWKLWFLLMVLILVFAVLGFPG